MLYVVPSREQGEKKIKPEIFAVPYTRYSVAAMDTKVLRSASPRQMGPDPTHLAELYKTKKNERKKNTRVMAAHDRSLGGPLTSKLSGWSGP